MSTRRNARLVTARLQRWLLAVGIAVTALGLCTATAFADTVPPPTLTGEIFTISPPTVTASCSPVGSTVSYAVSGTAIGPYTGTYTENGIVTIGPQTLPVFVDGFEAGPITSASISFTIDSPTGQVKGTKSLPAVTNGAFGLCYSPASGGGSFVELSATSSPLTYAATINTSSGGFGDTGYSGLTLDQVQGTVIAPGFPPTVIQPTNTFMEAFVSSLLVPFPICNQNSQTNQTQGGNNQGCVNP